MADYAGEKFNYEQTSCLSYAAKGQKMTYVRRLSLTYSLLLAIMTFCGCGYRDQIPSRLVKIEDKPNTFKVYAIRISLFERERIKAIQICEPPSNATSSSWDKMRVYWRVIAEKPIDTEGFEITAGIVPKGFTQEIPPHSEGFVPVRGKKYLIAVKMAYPLAPPWTGTDWVAK